MTLFLLIFLSFVIFCTYRQIKRSSDANKCEFTYHNEYVKHFGKCTACDSSKLKKEGENA